MKNKIARLLLVAAKILDETTDLMYQGCIYGEQLSYHLKRQALKTQSKPHEPTFYQWANRLIEYVDPEYILAAYYRFEKLVQAGIDHSHAFHMVVD